MHFFAPEEDDAFAPRAIPRALVKLTLPVRQPEQVKAKTQEKDPEASKDRPRPKRDQRSKGKPPAPPKWAALDRFKRNNLDEISRALDKTAGKAGKKKQAGTQSIALPSGSGSVASVVGFSEKGVGGIGREGLKSVGGLSGGNLGKGSIGGQLDRAVGRQVGAPPGSIDRDKVAAVINSHLAEVQRCYESALLGAQGLRGRVMLEWVIGMDGLVKSARSKTSSLKSPAVESCIIDRLKKWEFPRARGGSVTITYPFVFESSAF
jgi:TonB family protein